MQTDSNQILFFSSYSLLLRFVDDTFDPDLGATIGKENSLRLPFIHYYQMPHIVELAILSIYLFL